MIRLTLLSLLVSFLFIYAWRDWFKTTCWLVLLMAVFQHPDMPRSIAGIPGLNHWNLLFLSVVMSWLTQRHQLRAPFDLPKGMGVFFCLFYAFIIFATLRYLSDDTEVLALSHAYGAKPVLGSHAYFEYVINAFKWVIPAIILFDGARTKKDVKTVVLVVLLMNVLIAVQVIKVMKLGSLFIDGDVLQARALKLLVRDVGYHRVNVSMMMAGAFWAIFCLKVWASRSQFFFVIIPLCCITFLALGLTGGRMGYVTWAGIGAIVVLFKWRGYLLLAPVALLAIALVMPSSIERLSQGISQQDTEMTTAPIDYQQGDVDLYTVTSGRVLAWPLVVDSIAESPFIGHGKNAMITTGTTKFLLDTYGDGEAFAHPHNAYLQWLQDNGLLGFMVVAWLIVFVVKRAWHLFKLDERIDEGKYAFYVGIGGVSGCLWAGLLIAGFGSQSFYPREGSITTWVITMMLVRTYLIYEAESRKAHASSLDKSAKSSTLQYA